MYIYAILVSALQPFIAHVDYISCSITIPFTMLGEYVSQPSSEPASDYYITKNEEPSCVLVTAPRGHFLHFLQNLQPIVSPPSPISTTPT